MTAPSCAGKRYDSRTAIASRHIGTTFGGLSKVVRLVDPDRGKYFGVMSMVLIPDDAVVYGSPGFVPKSRFVPKCHALSQNAVFCPKIQSLVLKVVPKRQFWDKAHYPDGFLGAQVLEHGTADHSAQRLIIRISEP